MNDNTTTITMGVDEERWYSRLIDQYTSYVTAIISGISKGALSSSDIEEVAADVFFKIWLNRDHIRSDSVKAFIAQITRNASIDMLRKMKKEFVAYDDDILQVTCNEYPDELAIVRDQKQIVEESVKAFGEPEREIFIRFYYFGESIKTISKRLQMNISTIKTKLHRSRSKLKDIMQERGYRCE